MKNSILTFLLIMAITSVIINFVQGARYTELEIKHQGCLSEKINFIPAMLPPGKDYESEEEFQRYMIEELAEALQSSSGEVLIEKDMFGTETYSIKITWAN